MNHIIYTDRCNIIYLHASAAVKLLAITSNYIHTTIILLISIYACKFTHHFYLPTLYIPLALYIYTARAGIQYCRLLDQLSD